MICLILTSLAFMQKVNVKEVEKLIRIANIDEKKSLNFFNDLLNFNKIFQENINL